MDRPLKTTGKLQFRVEEDLELAIRALAQRRKEDIADVCRRILREGVSQEALVDGSDQMLKIVRDCMRDVLRPVEERLAKINAKTAISSGTAMWMTMQVLEEAGYDAQEVYTKARKKAVVQLQERDSES